MPLWKGLITLVLDGTVVVMLITVPEQDRNMVGVPRAGGSDLPPTTPPSRRESPSGAILLESLSDTV